MLVLAKVIVKGAVLATAALPLLSATSVQQTASTAPDVSVHADPKTTSNKPVLTETIPMSNGGLLEVDTVPGVAGGPSTKTYTLTRRPHPAPIPSNIPKSYYIYLLYRSDGTLIGPDGTVPLPKYEPKVNLINRPATALKPNAVGSRP